jgi:hypothetical protein
MRDILSLYDAKRSAQSLYHKWAWGSTIARQEVYVEASSPTVCLASDLGGAFRIRIIQQPDRFVGIGPVGILVWYEPDTDRFYLWINHWNFLNVLRPFVGNPKLALNQAIKPRKGERHFPGVNLSVMSQRWIYPDERQARMPRGPQYSDCSHGGPCGRDIEQQNLNTFITRFRLVNNTGRNIYYLGDLNSVDPIGYRLPEFVRRIDCDRTVERYYFET